MRRALDVARAKLSTSGSRDDILFCFFEHGTTLFDTAVLLLVRGEAAVGRAARGVEASPELVQRLSVPLDQPGILHRVRELRRPVTGIPTLADTDAQMFGTLGRTMPNALVSPLVVRDRVVAFFIGDRPAQKLGEAARAASRTPMELAKEEMLLWSESVGEALESFIVRRKGTGSIPPPRTGGSVRPPAASASVPLPPPPRTPSIRASARSTTPPPIFQAAPLEETLEAPPPSVAPGGGGAKWLLLVGVAVVVVGGIVAWRSRANDTDLDVVAVPGQKLAGFPAEVDPLAALPLAKGAAALGDGSELATIRAEVGPGGHVDARARPRNDEGLILSYAFVRDDVEAHVRVDSVGIRLPERRLKTALPVAPPKCTLEKVWAAAFGSTAGPDERAMVTYSARSRDEAGGPIWTVETHDRGRVRIDDATCAPLARETLRPPPVPHSALPRGGKGIDPLELVQLARTQAGLEKDAVVLEIDARGVGAGGKVDIGTNDGAIIYTLSDPTSVPATSRRWRQVEVRTMGMRVGADETRGPLPPKFDIELSPPRCTFAHAFAYATLERKTPVVGARLSYGPDVGGHQGRWTFEDGSSGERSISDVECEAWGALPH